MRINVCLASDDNYIKYDGVVIASILTNAKNDDDLYFYIIGDSVSEENKQKILSLKSIKKCSIDFVEFDKNIFNPYLKASTNSYIKTITTYFRLKTADLLPDIDKILYLDCDIVVNTSLSELFDMDFEENYAAGVIDIGNFRKVKRPKLKENAIYTNAGVLLMNLKKFVKIKLKMHF